MISGDDVLVRLQYIHCINAYLDIDECELQTADFDPNAECINTEGLFDWECKGGFTGGGKTCTGSENLSM